LTEQQKKNALAAESSFATPPVVTGSNIEEEYTDEF
jgi:hypothetical protein